MVGNVKGEVTLEHDGVPYRMRVDMNALADFEEVSGIPNALAALQNPAGLTAGQMRDFVWCALRQEHPEIDKRTAGRIASIDTMNKAFAAIVPDQAAVGNGQAAA